MGRDFLHLSRPALGPTQPPVHGYRDFPGGKERPGLDADPSPPSSAVGHERVELYLYPPVGRTACTGPQCLYKGDLYLVVSFVSKVCLSHCYVNIIKCLPSAF